MDELFYLVYGSVTYVGEKVEHFHCTEGGGEFHAANKFRVVMD
jgi:hypothetical protein